MFGVSAVPRDSASLVQICNFVYTPKIFSSNSLNPEAFKMKLDNFRLIAEVEQRRALWDSYMSMAARKDVGGKQWQEVADIMQVDGEFL